MATVAIHDTFLESYARLPHTEQKRVKRLIDDLRTDRVGGSRRLERYLEAADDKVYSIRLSDAYRAIVVRPPGENVYLLAWVDHHDEAYRWARRRRFEVNPYTRTLQVWDVEETGVPGTGTEAVAHHRAQVDSEIGERAEAENKVAWLDALTDEMLLRLGIPADFLPRLRRIHSESDLEQLVAVLPQEAGEALQFLAIGEPYESVLQWVLESTGVGAGAGADEATYGEPTGGHIPVPAAANELEGGGASPQSASNAKGGGVATANVLPVREANPAPGSFLDALTRHGSRRVAVVTSDEQLQAMLDQPLAKWRTFLHPSQRSLVEGHFHGPVRVLGGAGTGKTVVALHRARWLAQHLEGGRILVTTFNRNLAETLRQQLESMCTPDELERLEVCGIDQLAYRVFQLALRENGRSVSHPELFDPADRRALSYWDAALREEGWDLSQRRLVIDEYVQVIQFHGIDTWDEYVATPRTGRGVRLSRPQRASLWRVVEKFRTITQAEGLYTFTDILRIARQWLESHPGIVVFRAAVVDEAQDLHPEAFRLLRVLVPPGDNDLFITGDAHQRIYGSRVVLSRCGIHIRGRRSRRLRINYRTTEQIRRDALGVLSGLAIDDLDEGIDDGRDVSLLSGPKPDRVHFATVEQE
ncbi:MAG: AAA family ATPase, partial [Alicyclobacillaceae bacterium]|nr:AAA family ATPase [Alicyclobacillaceae bacterium]